MLGALYSGPKSCPSWYISKNITSYYIKDKTNISIYIQASKQTSIHTTNTYTDYKIPHLIIFPVMLQGVPVLPQRVSFNGKRVDSPLVQGDPKLSHLLDGARFRSFHLTTNGNFLTLLAIKQKNSLTLSAIIMEVENDQKWKETNIEGTHFQLPWLWEDK